MQTSAISCLNPGSNCSLEMLHDFTSIQSDFDIMNMAISNNPFRPWTSYPSPSPLKSPPICANYVSGPWRSGGSNCSICSMLATPLGQGHSKVKYLVTYCDGRRHPHRRLSVEVSSSFFDVRWGNWREMSRVVAWFDIFCHDSGDDDCGHVQWFTFINYL